MINLILRCFCLSLVFFSSSLSARPNLERTELRFDTSITNKSLPNSPIFAITQDKRGFMWFGSNDGLIRFDGTKSVTYRAQLGSKTSIKNNVITALLSDRNGRFWVGTPDGLQEFNLEEETFRDVIPASIYSLNPKLKRILSIAEDNNGDLWVGSSAGVLKYFTKSQKIEVALHHPSSNVEIGFTGVNTLTVDSSNTLWLGTDIGLYFLRDGAEKFEEVELPELHPSVGQIKGLLEVTKVYYSSHTSTIWVGTARGLYSIRLRGDGKEIKYKALRVYEGLPVGAITEIGSNKEGDFWVGTISNGLFIKKSSEARFRVVRHSDVNVYSLLEDAVLTSFQDSSGVMWLAAVRGLSKVDLSSGGFHRVSRVTERYRLEDDFITAVTGDLKGQIFLGTRDNGIIIWNRKEGYLKRYKHRKNEHLARYRDRIHNLTLDKRGRLWVTTPAGLEFFDARIGRFKLHIGRPEEPSLANTFRSICDRSGHLWFTSNRGLLKFDPETKKSSWIRPSNHIGRLDHFEAAYSIAEGANGDIFFTTENGLQRVSPDAMSYESKVTSSSVGDNFSNFIKALSVDKAGRIWIAKDSEIAVIDSFMLINRAEVSIPIKTNVSSITHDRNGNIWLYTSRGISSFDPKSFQYKYYPQSLERDSSGLLSEQSFVDETNTIYFVGAYGITYFNPIDIFENVNPPRIAITKIDVVEKGIGTGKEDTIKLNHGSSSKDRQVEVPYGQSSVLIEFAALHFANPSENRYRYILENFDHDWIEVDSSKNFVQYSNLDPGRYVFKVMAASGHQVWSEEATVQLVVVPPIWKRMEFWGFAITLALVILWIIHNRTLRRHLAIRNALEAEIKERTLEIATQNKNKSKFIADAAHDLRQPIHAIGNLLEAIRIAFEKNDHTKSMELLQLAKTATSLMRSTFNSILELSRLETGLIEPKYAAIDLSSLVQDSIVTLTALALEKDVNIRFVEYPGKSYNVRTDKVLLSRVLANLISNSIKYSKRSSAKVILRLVRFDSRCRLYILDNGIGMKAEDLTKIFQPFYQVNNPEHDREQGLGLGLSIVNATISVLDDHAIKVCSVPEKGTLFSIDLPLTAPSFELSDQIIELRDSNEFSISGLYLIYVEDDLLVRTSTEILLREFGVLVKSYKSANELFGEIGSIERLPDLILTDHNLPNNFTSEEVILAIRNEFDEEIPAIVVSGDFIETRSRLKTFATVVLSKPTLPGELIRSIQKTCEPIAKLRNREK